MSRAYYNEIDPYAAQWLRNLIAGGHIAPGDVDERSIVDVRPSDLEGYAQCHFFAGIGGWSLALRLAGWSDDRPVWTGSCPCQPFSAAGKGGGFADERHLWPAFHHLIRECGPGVVFGEQVASKDGLAWLDLVQADLEGSAYASGAVDLCAAGVGAPHGRQRLFWVAYTDTAGRCRSAQSHQQETRGHEAPRRRDADGRGSSPWAAARAVAGADGTRRLLEPGIKPLAHGAASRVGRLRAYGNAIVPQVAAEVIGAFLDVEGRANLADATSSNPPSMEGR